MLQASPQAAQRSRSPARRSVAETSRVGFYGSKTLQQVER